MAELVVKSAFVSAVADGADATLVRPSNWNAGMAPDSGQLSAAFGGTGIAYFTVAGPTVARTYTFPDAAATIARTDAANTFTGVQTFSTPIATASVAAMSATVGGGVPTPPNNTTTFLRGDGTFAAPAGGASLNGITAATGAVTIASGNNTGIVWNWANTTNTTVAFTLGETTAATGGTSTAGVPNQVLLKLATLATSTMSPLQVYSRAVHCFSVSPTATPQILTRDGAVGTPVLAFASAMTTGLYLTANSGVGFAVEGAFQGEFWTRGLLAKTSTAALPSIAEAVAGTTGLFFAATLLGITYAGAENGRIISGGWQYSYGAADAVSYALNFRKSRGTVASPTVITTGDDLATFSGFGYVGATNTYQEAARITFDSTGTIADTATGIGGIITFSHATVGAEPVTVAQMKSQHIIHSGTAPTITAGGGTSPSIVGTDESFVVTIGTGGTATTVEITFGNAFTTNPPTVLPISDTDLVSYKITPLTNKVTITATAAFTAGSKLYCTARGWE